MFTHLFISPAPRRSKNDGIWCQKQISICPSFLNSAPRFVWAPAVGARSRGTAKASVPGELRVTSQQPGVSCSAACVWKREALLRRRDSCVWLPGPGPGRSLQPVTHEAPGAHGARSTGCGRGLHCGWGLTACRRSSPETGRRRRGCTPLWG